MVKSTQFGKLGPLEHHFHAQGAKARVLLKAPGKSAKSTRLALEHVLFGLLGPKLKICIHRHLLLL